MERKAVDKLVDEVRKLLEERLRIKGRSLAHQLRRAGRLLPKRMQRDGRYLDQARTMTAHPTLALMIDDTRVKAAHKRLVSHLKSIDPKEERKTKLIRIAAVIAFNLLVVIVLFLLVLNWRGLL